MSARAALLAGRRAAEAQMVDTCTVRPVTGETTDADGDVVPTYGAALYTGRCKVQALEGQERDGAGGAITVQRYRVDVPAGSFVPAVGHVVTITSATFDPNLVGRAYRVVALLHKTAATAYRLAVEEVL